MKAIRSLSLSLLVVLYGLPLTTRASVSSAFFSLPDAQVSESYRADIEAVLRDRYRLKIETGVRESILQWDLVDGEVPSGLVIRTDGTISGVPKAYRQQAYHFRVKVVDVSVNGAEPLVIPLSLSIGPPRLRLTKIGGPTLAAIETASAQPDTPDVRSDEASASGERLAARRAAESEEHSAQSNKSLGNLTSQMGDAFSSQEVARAYNSAAVALPGGSTRKRGVISRVAGILGLAQGGGGAGHPAGGARTGCASRGHTVESDEAHTPLEGDTSTQNTCVKFMNLNPLKYRYEFNEKRTTTAGPDISSLPFLPKITPTTPSSVTAPTEPQSRPPPYRRLPRGHSAET